MIANLQEHQCKSLVMFRFAKPRRMEGLRADTEFIRSLVKWAGLKPAQLAKRAGVAATTILRPFKGTAETRLSQPTFEKLKVSFPDFPGWKNEYSDHVGMHGDRADPTEKPEELGYVRQVDISLGMGEGVVIEDYPPVGLLPFNLGFVQALARSRNIDDLFVCDGIGESMEPTLHRGDVIMVDTSFKSLGMGDTIWAINYAGCGYIKRLRPVETEAGRRILIMSDNPQVPDQIAYPEEVHLVGKVVWFSRSL